MEAAEKVVGALVDGIPTVPGSVLLKNVLPEQTVIASEDVILTKSEADSLIENQKAQAQAEVQAVLESIAAKGQIESGFPFKGLMKTKVQLPEATALYQPVFGTDAESLYHCVALSPEINVAVRIKTDSKVSIRVAGQPNALAKCDKALKAAGLSPSNNYYSVHLSTGSADLTRKSVGAVLFGMGIPFTAVATDLLPIFGKGQ